VSPEWIALRGRDFPDLGPLGSAALPGAGAVALSRGAQPKSYPHTDPNEDGVGIARSADGVLLAVVDGHNGAAASEIALDAVRSRAASLLGAGRHGFLLEVQTLIAQATRAMAGIGRSRTCLLVATVTDFGCLWGSFGDCQLYRSGGSEPLILPNDLWLGPGLGAVGAGAGVWAGAFDCVPGERIAAASDGVANFVLESARIPGLLAEAEDERGAARALAKAALSGGAGDNVAVAVCSAPANDSESP